MAGFDRDCVLDVDFAEGQQGVRKKTVNLVASEGSDGYIITFIALKSAQQNN